MAHKTAAKVTSATKKTAKKVVNNAKSAVGKVVNTAKKAAKKATKVVKPKKTAVPKARTQKKAAVKAAVKKESPTVVIVGSSFVDYIGYCDRVPVAGETVHSQNFQKGFGGKGANQAFMVALQKGKVAVKMATAVGTDGDGDAYINNLKSVGIDTTFCQQVKGESTGLAMISVSTKTGQNQIVICPNATQKFIPATINWEKVFGAKRDQQKPNNALIVQNEIPLETTLKALEEASARGMLTVFNPAPAPSADEIAKIKPYMKYVDIFCPNETEASLMTGQKEVTTANAKATCEKLLQIGAKNVVMTMGSQGYSIYKSDGSFNFYPAAKVANVVDTTGAGDCFVGTLVHTLLSKGRTELETACQYANVASSISVQGKGTQSSFPNATKLHAALKK